MKKYFYSNGSERLGPFTVDELKEKNIQPSTLVWSEGMASWQEAKTIDELKVSLNLIVPPPLPSAVPVFHNQPTQFYQNNAPKEKKGFGVTSGVIVGILVLLAVVAIYLSQNKSSETNPNAAILGNTRGIIEREREKTPEEIKQDLKSKEEAEPLQYLRLTYDVNEAFDGRARIRGKVINNASVAKFKDAVIRMTFYTKTDSEISTEDKTLVEFLEPTSSKSFDWKIRTPNKTVKVGLRIVDVTTVAPSVEFE